MLASPSCHLRYYDSSVKYCLFKTAVNVAIYACLASCSLLKLRSEKDSNCCRLITETLLCDGKSDISIRSIDKQEQEFYWNAAGLRRSFNCKAQCWWSLFHSLSWNTLKRSYLEAGRHVFIDLWDEILWRRCWISHECQMKITPEHFDLIFVDNTLRT